MGIEQQERAEGEATIQLPTTMVVQSRSMDVLREAEEIKVTDDPSYEAADRFVREIIIPFEKEIGQTFDDSINEAHKLHKRILEQKKKYGTPLDEAKRRINRSMSDYLIQRERKAKEEAARIEAEQRKRLDDEQLAEAQAHVEAGDHIAAEQVLGEQINLPPAQIPAVPKVEGTSAPKDWKAEVKDLKALVLAVAAGRVPMAAVVANEKFLNSQAKSLKSEMVYPGVRVWWEYRIARRFK